MIFCGITLYHCSGNYFVFNLFFFMFQSVYHLTENVRILRMPETQLRQLAHEPYEYSEVPRADEPEWDQLVKFASRKVYLIYFILNLN